MKSLLLLWKMVAQECATWCNTSATMDIKNVQGRVENEGLSFLTITLPEFGKGFQKSLDQGQASSDHFTGFRFSGGLPIFLSGFLRSVFHTGSGRLLDEPNIEAIRAIRQLTLMFSKVNLPCTLERERAAFTGFVECEQEVRQNWTRLDPELKRSYSSVANTVFGMMFYRMDSDIRSINLMPKHGPGAVAERYSSNEKYYRAAWTTRLEEVFPSGDFLTPNSRFWRELGQVELLDPGSEIPVRVISVPKTQKTPRIIAIEPTAMQFAQQAVLDCFLRSLKQDSILSEMIGIDDQVPNQDLARLGSSDGSLATLDLSEASDRVSNQHVRELVKYHGSLRRAIDATRSRKADIPGHGVKRLAKYASMGSATCFPFEACTFLVLILIGISRSRNLPVTRKLLHSLRHQVRVFGDDIIVPVDCVESVVSVLEAFGHKVNRNKSFWTGKFRESCGKDYYDGEDVSIFKVRRPFPVNRQDAAEAISTVSLRNQAYMFGYWRTAAWLDEVLPRIIKYYPTVKPSSPALGRHTFLDYQVEKMCPHLHRPLVKALVVKGSPPVDELSDYGALVKFHLKRGKDPLPDGHLERSGRPHSVHTKVRWCPPF